MLTAGVSAGRAVRSPRLYATTGDGSSFPRFLRKGVPFFLRESPPSVDRLQLTPPCEDAAPSVSRGTKSRTKTLERPFCGGSRSLETEKEGRAPAVVSPGPGLNSALTKKPQGFSAVQRLATTS